jgi:hypothetical protein
MALDDSLLAAVGALGLAQLFLDWVVLEVVVHLLVTAHLLVQPQELQIQAEAVVRALVMLW